MNPTNQTPQQQKSQPDVRAQNQGAIGLPDQQAKDEQNPRANPWEGKGDKDGKEGKEPKNNPYKTAGQEND